MLNNYRIGDKIYELRKAKGMTGEKLAELLNISPQAVSKWENGKSLPETVHLPVLAKILKCSIDELLMPANGVFFINATIENEVRKVLGKGESDDLSEEDILSITELKLNGLGLTDISDLEQFKNLTKLEICSNSLTDLTPLSSLIKLETLAAGNDPFASDEEREKQKNHYKNLDFLKDLTNLKDISFIYCGITDITPIAHLKNLEEARLFSNKIEDISPIKELKNLKKIYFFDCRVTDISVVKYLPQLEGIAINCNQVDDLSPLENCVNMTYLDAHDNRIYNIKPLKKLTKMIYLTLANNNITNLEGIEDMQQLEHLTLSFNPVAKNIGAVKNLKRLKYLELREMNITDDVKEDLKKAMPECNIYYTYDEPGRFESE